MQDTQHTAMHGFMFFIEENQGQAAHIDVSVIEKSVAEVGYILQDKYDGKLITVRIVDSVSLADKTTFLTAASLKERAESSVRSRPWSWYSVSRACISARVLMINVGIVYGKIVKYPRFSTIQREFLFG